MIHTLRAIFIDNIPAGYDEAVVRLDDIALEAILVRLVEELPEDKLLEFETALSLSDPRILEGFLEKEVPMLRSLVLETLSGIEHRATEMIAVLES